MDFGSEADLARESAVKEGVHSIRIGVESWAVDHGDTYPDAPRVSAFGLSEFVSIWPTNPYTDRPMSQGDGPGDFAYTVSAAGRSFGLVGYGKSGEIVINVP